jgi:hypothetical protein
MIFSHGNSNKLTMQFASYLTKNRAYLNSNSEKISTVLVFLKEKLKTPLEKRHFFCFVFFGRAKKMKKGN